jgi:2-iminobutanoate/2-iminopropanoate deaminase
MDLAMIEESLRRATTIEKRAMRAPAAFNEERTAFYAAEGLDPLPASTGIQAILCRPDLLVEIEAIAVLRNRPAQE